MDITTKSGVLTVNKRSHYGQFLIGFTSTPAWSGAATLSDVWTKARMHKPVGVSWLAYGKICGRLVWHGVAVDCVFEEV